MVGGGMFISILKDFTIIFSYQKLWFESKNIIEEYGFFMFNQIVVVMKL